MRSAMIMRAASTVSAGVTMVTTGTVIISMTSTARAFMSTITGAAAGTAGVLTGDRPSASALDGVTIPGAGTAGMAAGVIPGTAAAGITPAITATIPDGMVADTAVAGMAADGPEVITTLVLPTHGARVVLPLPGSSMATAAIIRPDLITGVALPSVHSTGAAVTTCSLVT